MRTVLFVFALLLVPAFAQAQHACDVPAGGFPTSGTVPNLTGPAVDFCAPASDNVEAVTVYLAKDGGAEQAIQLTTVTKMTPTPNAAGHVLLRARLGAMNSGAYSLAIKTWNTSATGVAQESPRSLPFSLTVAKPPQPAPTQPVIVSIHP